MVGARLRLQNRDPLAATHQQPRAGEFLVLGAEQVSVDGNLHIGGIKADQVQVEQRM